MATIFRSFLATSLCLFACTSVAFAQEKKPAEAKTLEESELPAGHSQHGETFNQGPRQKAYLMPGTGTVHFPVSSKVENVQKFVEQGIGQVHGFWYFEAERSFRQAAKLDPNCAIAYWGMALANANNGKRAKAFIAEAVKRKVDASEREAMYIDAYDAYLNTSDATKKAKAYVRAMELILEKYPKDIEAKAQIGYVLYKSRGRLKRKYEDVDKVLKGVLAAEPMHPVHHYRIHLWDYKTPANALDSSAECGQAAPAIAHMWHMPGHIYSRLKRYDDAVFHQEASARVDHAQMMRDRVMPDQIHNFAHNNEWLARSLAHVGRWRDSIDLAKNMIEMPRHPRYNTLKKRGSTNYGRMRLFGVLRRYEAWQQLIQLAHTPYLEPTDVEAEQVKRLEHLGIAYASTKNDPEVQKIIADLKSRKVAIESEIKAAEAKSKEQKKTPEKEKPKNEAAKKEEPKDKPAAEPKEPAKPVADKEAIAKQEAAKKAEAKKKADAKKLAKKKAKERKDRLQRVDKAIAVIQGRLAAAKGEYAAAVPLLEKGGEDKLVLARFQCLAGQKDKGVKTAADFMKKNGKRVQMMAGQVEVLWLAGKKDDAAKVFDELRELSGSIQRGTPIFARLDPIAKELGWPTDWRYARDIPKDIGKRPALNSLGPFRWQPMPAVDWSLKDHEGKAHSLKQFHGRPVIVIFYLGYACLHCAEQLHAFAPMAEEYRKAGISIIAVSTDKAEGLKTSLKNYEGKMPFPLVSNAEMDVFKKYRAFDDFEDIPLHGTYLIDKEGRVRWQDISYEPFMDAKFLLAESKRLLAQNEKPLPIVRVDPPPAQPKTDKPGPSQTKIARIDPAGIGGSLIISGNDVPDAAWDSFLDLAQDKKARVVVLRTDSSDATKARIARLVEVANKRDAASVKLLRVESVNDVDDKAIAAMKDATAIWLASDDESKLWKLVASSAIERECRASLDRGGVVGGSSASLAVMSRFRPSKDSRPATAADEVAFLPDAFIEIASVSEDSSSRVPRTIEKLPRTVGYEIDSNTALVLHRRYMRAVGPGKVSIYLPASTSRKAKQIVLDGPRDFADLTSLRHAVANRAEENFPPKKLDAPQVQKGTLILIGGGGMPAGIMKKFVELAGGDKASIVVLPTAVPDPVPERNGIAEQFKRLGARNVKVLPGRTLEKVESEEYLDALRNATGVWFGGGRQWRFVDAYAGTKAEKLLHDVVARGGVIMGSSAGASIQAEYLARGNPLGNLDIMAEGYERGLGFLKGVAVDQHFAQRKRFADMSKLVNQYPQILGIGIDESTALVVRGKTGEVTGRGSVHFYDAAKKPTADKKDYESVDSGGQYDLVNRKVLPLGRSN